MFTISFEICRLDEKYTNRLENAHTIQKTFHSKEEKPHREPYLLHVLHILPGMDLCCAMFLHVLSQHAGVLDLSPHNRTVQESLVRAPY